MECNAVHHNNEFEICDYRVNGRFIHDPKSKILFEIDPKPDPKTNHFNAIVTRNPKLNRINSYLNAIAEE